MTPSGILSCNGSMITQVRKSCRLTQEALAEAPGLSLRVIRRIFQSRRLLALFASGFIGAGPNWRTAAPAFAQEIATENVTASEHDLENVEVSKLNESFTSLVEDWRLGRLSVESQPSSIRDLIDAVRPMQAADAGRFNGGLTFTDLFRIRQMIDGAHLRAQWKKFADYEAVVKKYEDALPGEINEELPAEGGAQSEAETVVETLVESEPKLSLIDSAMTAWKKGRLRIKDLPETQQQILVKIGRGGIPHSGAENDGVLKIHLQQLEAELLWEQHRIAIVHDLNTAIDRGSPDPRIHYFHSALLVKSDKTQSRLSFEQGRQLETSVVAMRIVDNDRFLNKTFPLVVEARGAPYSQLLQREYKIDESTDGEILPSSIESESGNRNAEIISAQNYIVSESLRLIDNCATGSSGLSFMRKQLAAWHTPDKDLLKPELPQETTESLTTVESALRTVLLLPYSDRLSEIETVQIPNAATLSSEPESLRGALGWLMQLAIASRDVDGTLIPFNLTRVKDKVSGELVDNPKIKALKQAID